MSIPHSTGQEEKWKNRIVWLHNESNDGDQQKSIHGPVRGSGAEF